MKKFFWIFIVLIFVVVALAVILFLIVNRVNMDFAKKAETCFVYDDINSKNLLNDKELKELKTIFDGKIMYSDNPSCGFTEDISVKFNNNQTFCIARDNCPIVYWKEKNKYIRLSEKEKTKLYDLLSPYGFFFPCV